MVENKDKPDKKDLEYLKTRKKLLKVILIGYILILLISLYIMFSNVDNEGLNRLYTELDKSCYNSEQLKEYGNFTVNEEYIVFYNDKRFNKFNCSVMLRSEYRNSLGLE